MERLKDHSFAYPRQATGKEPLSVEAVERVKNFFTENYRSHIRGASDRLDLSMGTVWKVLRKNLKWKAFKPHKVQVLSPANKLARKSACEFWLTFPESWFERVIWTDEKWFVLRSPPHSQNDRYWAPANQHEVVVWRAIAEDYAAHQEESCALCSGERRAFWTFIACKLFAI